MQFVLSTPLTVGHKMVNTLVYATGEAREETTIRFDHALNMTSLLEQKPAETRNYENFS